MSGKKNIDIFDFMRAIPDIPQNERGVWREAKCPCGGTIKAIRNEENGHLFAMCEDCKAKLIE